MLRLTVRAFAFNSTTKENDNESQIAGAGIASTAVAAPAIAQSTPALRWRLTTSFPKTLDTLYGACEMFAKAIGELSDQKFQISVYVPGEIVPAFHVFDAVAV